MRSLLTICKPTGFPTRLSLLALALSAFCAAATAGAVLDPPSFFASCTGAQYFAAGTYPCPGTSLTVGSSPDPIAQTITAGDASGQSTVVYEFIITGGNPGDTVPFDVAGNLLTTAGGGASSASGNAGIEVDTSSISLSQSVSCGYVPGFSDTCLTPAWSGTLSGVTTSGFVNDVHLTATSGSQGDANSSALADPYIYIDPTFAAANPQYALTVGAANPAPSTPEPAAGFLCTGPLLALALWLRRAKTA